MNATGTSVGRSYLGVPRMNPIAGTDRSLGKLLRRELADLYGDSWWDPDLHPWVFCSFAKTLTAVWHGQQTLAKQQPQPEPVAVLRYQWMGIVPVTNSLNPRFHLRIPPHQRAAVANWGFTVRLHHGRSFVERELGFFGAVPAKTPGGSLTTSTVVLNTICARARSAHDASQSIRRDLESWRSRVERHRNWCQRDKAVEAEARVRRLEHLELVVQLWTDEMLDLAYWMQRNPTVRRRGYTDAPDLCRSANLLLYPHGRRFVSINDTPDLVSWLPYTSACQERNYWSPPGGAGGLTVSVASGASSSTTRSSAASASSSKSGGSSSSASSSAAANQGMTALAHMVLSKATSHPCKVRNLDKIAARNALEDPPVGLAAMDMVHLLLMGNYPGCGYRPPFAVRARVRVQSLVFRGATAQETTHWLRTHYRLLHLAFKQWYDQVVQWSPAYEAVVGQVQHHAEYVMHGRRAADELRGMLSTYGRATHASVARTLREHGYARDFIGVPPSAALDDAAHMSHGASLRTFGKLRKGSFVVTICDRMRGWLRALCTGKEKMAQQYKEELTQMMVLSKILYSQPEYGARVVEDIQASLRNESVTKDVQEACWRNTPHHDAIQRWALGAPLASLPSALIESFLKWEGDSALTGSPWFADRSFFLSQPYPFLGDTDTLRAIDLAAWMCARRTDGRFVMSWLRYPIGLSALAYQRLQTLYFSYECCDIADNSFLVQLRRFLFRRRTRVISATEYRARTAAGDASIVAELTEPIKCVAPQPVSGKEDSSNDAAGPTPVAYRVVEEYGTAESRRDFAILYEYVTRVVAYSSWSVIPLPKRVTAHQIEAVRRRQTIEPWRRTDVDLLGSRHLCACGRWCSQVVTPPLRSITSSVTERRGSAPPGSTLAKIRSDTDRRLAQLRSTLQADLKQVAERHHQMRALHRQYKQQQQDSLSTMVTPLDSSQEDGDETEDESEDEAMASRRLVQVYEREKAAVLHHAETAMARIESEQPVLYNVVPTRRSARPLSVEAICSTSTGGDLGVSLDAMAVSGAGAVSALDSRDVRISVRSGRWADPDWMLRYQPNGVADQSTATKRSSSRASDPPAQPSTVQTVLPASAEPVTRDVHPTVQSYVIGGAYVTRDLGYDPGPGGGARLVSKERNRAPYCCGQLFRVPLLGKAVRLKGPKAATDGPWYVICATCGCLTTLDMGRWDHKGPSCGAHGRPHRLPQRLAAYDPRREGREVATRAQVRAAQWLTSRRLVHDLVNPFVPRVRVAQRIRSDLSLLDSQAGLPCPDEVPCCWYCGMPSDKRQSSNSRAAATASAKNSQDSADAMLSDQRQQQQQQQQQQGSWSGLPTVRYQVGTSVATAPIGSAGAALYARRKTVSSTDQADPVRRINVRGSMFGHLGGPYGGALLVPPRVGRSQAPHAHRCATNGCECYRLQGHHGSEFEEMHRVHRRHAVTMEARVLPAELLPAVGQELCIKVLDDVGPGASMRLRWIYLCPLHMKDLRVGWISERGRIVQGEVEARAALAVRNAGGNLNRLKQAELVRAASGQRIGRPAMVRHMFSQVQLLSWVVAALRRGRRTRVRRELRFGQSIKGVRRIPDYGDRRKKRDG